MAKSPRTYAVEPEEACLILLDAGIREAIQALVKDARKSRTTDFLQSYWSAVVTLNRGKWSFAAIDSQPTSADWSGVMPGKRWKQEAMGLAGLRGCPALLEARGPKSDGWEVYLVTLSDRGAVQRTHLCSINR